MWGTKQIVQKLHGTLNIKFSTSYRGILELIQPLHISARSYMHKPTIKYMNIGSTNTE